MIDQNINQHHKHYLGWSPTFGPLQQGFTHGSMNFGSHPYAYRSNKDLRNQTVPADRYPKDALTDGAIDFIQKHHEQPFFLYVSEYFVHDPVHSRCEWLLDKYRDRLPADAPTVRTADGAMVETLDHLVGRVIGAIDDAGIADNTVVVLTSDNGGHPKYTSNAPLRGSKWNLYEGGIRVPLIVRWPAKVTAGITSSAVAHACDLLPTFCDIATAPLPTVPIDGVSLLPHLTGSTASIERSSPLVWHFPYYHPEKRFRRSPTSIGVADFATSQTRPHSAIRDGDWKLLNFYEDDHIEMFKVDTRESLAVGIR